MLYTYILRSKRESFKKVNSTHSWDDAGENGGMIYNLHAPMKLKWMTFAHSFQLGNLISYEGVYGMSKDGGRRQLKDGKHI